MTPILITLLPFFPFALVAFYYIQISLTGEFEYLWNSREIYEEDIQ